MKTSSGYRKRYWPFIIMVVWLIAGLGGFCVWAERGANGVLLTKRLLAAVILWLDGLLALIWKLEAVYWFSGGPNFEAAKAAGSACRRRYAAQHLKQFLLATLPMLGYLALSAYWNWTIWLDLALVCVGTIAAAISTLSISFK